MYCYCIVTDKYKHSFYQCCGQNHHHKHRYHRHSLLTNLFSFVINYFDVVFYDRINLHYRSLQFVWFFFSFILVFFTLISFSFYPIWFFYSRCTSEPFLPPPVFLQDIVPGTGPGNSPRAAAAIAAAGKTPGEVRICLLFILWHVYSVACLFYFLFCFWHVFVSFCTMFEVFLFLILLLSYVYSALYWMFFSVYLVFLFLSHIWSLYHDLSVVSTFFMSTLSCITTKII